MARLHDTVAPTPPPLPPDDGPGVTSLQDPPPPPVALRLYEAPVMEDMPPWAPVAWPAPPNPPAPTVMFHVATPVKVPVRNPPAPPPPAAHLLPDTPPPPPPPATTSTLYVQAAHVVFSFAVPAPVQL